MTVINQSKIGKKFIFQNQYVTRTTKNLAKNKRPGNRANK